MVISDKIEAFITELLKSSESDWLEIGRNEIAAIFNCAPSQINYVISTRFSPEKGYAVESKRGGGGYIKIKKAKTDVFGDISRLTENIGKSITEEKAGEIIKYLYSTGRIDETAKDIINAAVCTGVLSGEEKEDALRAKVLKNIILKTIQKG